QLPDASFTRSLAAHPVFNAAWEGQDLMRWDHVNIGIAVEVSDGLVAPAILGCEALDLAATNEALSDLVARVRAGKARAREWSEPTFTLSNLGMFGVAQFTAIIVPPQIAILATGRIEARAVVRDGAIVVRQVMAATLSADHRAVEGGNGPVPWNGQGIFGAFREMIRLAVIGA